MKLIVFLGLLLITQAVQEPSRQADIQSKNDKQTPLVRALLNMGELAQLSQQIDFSRLINAIDELQTLVEDSLAQETSLFQQDFLSYSSDQEFYKNQITQFETEVATHQVDLSDLLQSRDGLQKLLGEKAQEQAETARISGDLSNNIKDDEKVYFASLQEYDEAIEALDEALELLNGELSLVQVEQIQGSSDRIKNRLQKLRVFYQPIVLALAQLNQPRYLFKCKVQKSFADSELYSKVRKILNELRASLAASRITLTNSYEAIRSDNLAIFEQYQDRLNNLSDIIIPQIKEDIGTVDGQISTKQSLLKDAQANLDSAEESLQATETAWIARQNDNQKLTRQYDFELTQLQQVRNTFDRAGIKK
ncbi:hypothetical protein pb186bvf_004299 [Paramecium bursaria]